MEEYGLSDDTTDPDFDGFQTLEEYICGTDPTNGASFFQVGIAADGVQIPSVSNRIYNVEGRAALAVSNGSTSSPQVAWQNVTNNLPGSGNILTVPLTTNRFYRVGVSFP